MTPQDMLRQSLRLIIEEEIDRALARRGLAVQQLADSAVTAQRSFRGAEVLEAVSAYFQLSPAAIRAPGRPEPAATVRQIVMVLAVEFGLARQSAVHLVGRTDASTADAARRSIAAKLAADPGLAAAMQTLRNTIAAALQIPTPTSK